MTINFNQVGWYKGWPDMPTRQSKEILSELTESRETQSALLLISNTGNGKTKSIQLFKKNRPPHFYVITVGNSYQLHDVVDSLMEELNINVEFNSRTHEIKKKLRAIARRCDEITQTENIIPVLVIDEAENLKPAVLKMLKELYDAVHEYASIVLIGTPQILDTMLNLRSKNRQGVPQLWRRFKAGTRYITNIDKGKDFFPFLNLLTPGNKALQDLIFSIADNYGELKDYLDPVCRLASKRGVPVTEELFRLKHKIPHQLKRA